MSTQQSARPALDQPHRGIAHLLHPQVLGAIIGSAGASAFVFVNKDILPEPWPSVAVVAWALTLLGCAWTVLLRARRLRELEAPHPRAGLVYTAAVAGMLGAFLFGRVVLDAVGLPELQPAVIVMAVGLHFVPFAHVFDAPVFGALGWSIFAVGLLSLLLGLAAGAVFVAAGAVATGLLMLAFIGLDAMHDERVLG
ncbi:MAG: hypothetical protein WBG36_03090 [Ornithinimicrobium sp.]